MPKKPKMSELKNRIIFQTEAVVDNSSVWSDSLEVWAKIEAFRSYSQSAEIFRHGVLTTREGYKIYVRYDSSVNSKMRIKFGSKILRIEKMLNIDEQNEWIEIETF